MPLKFFMIFIDRKKAILASDPVLQIHAVFS
jgi:hypothetical protein